MSAKHTPGPILSDADRATERDAFERAMREHRPNIDLRRHPGDYYVHDWTMHMWLGWQYRAAIAKATGSAA